MNKIEEICDSAIMENELTKGYHAFKIGKTEDREGVNTKCLIHPFSNKYIVDIRDVPVSFERFSSFDPNVRATSGFYTIRYVPFNHKDRVKNKPYIIGQDLVRLRVCVSGPAHWRALTTRIPELGWIRRNSTFTEDLFRIAKQHPGMVIRFCLNVSKYCEKIERIAAEQNIDIDHKPLVAFTCSGKDYENIYSKKELGEIRTKADYLEALSLTEEIADEEFKGE